MTYAPGVRDATLAVTLPGIQAWTIACDAGIREEIGRLIGVYEQKGDEQVPDCVDVSDYGDGLRSQVSTSAGIASRWFPSRGELQERVNAYVDALYAELDDSHQTVAKQAERIDYLECHESQAVEIQNRQIEELKLELADALDQLRQRLDRIDALESHEAQTGEILNQRVATLNEQVNKQDYLINELRDEETRLKSELEYYKTRTRGLSEVNQIIGDANDALRAHKIRLSERIVKIREALGYNEIVLDPLALERILGDETEAAAAWCIRQQLDALESENKRLRSRGRVDIDVAVNGLDVLNTQLDAVVEKMKVIRGG